MRSVLASVLGLVLCGAAAQERPCRGGMVPTGLGTCIDEFEWPNQAGEKPKLAVSGIPGVGDPEGWDAETLCQSAGKRVCTRDEWVTACRGEGGSDYPYGFNHKVGVCNDDKLWRAPDELLVDRRNPEEISRLSQAEPAGTRGGCQSHSGAFDMVGSAEEWVRCPGIGRFGWCLMGRFWADSESCVYTVTVHSPKWHYYSTGFRCCAGATK